MLSIKFRDRKRVSVKVKLEVINAVFDIIGVNSRKDILFSDYTFSRVEDSDSIEWLDDLIQNNILDKLSNDYYITVTAIAPMGSIRAEINPNVARRNVFNCSHVDINIENDILLYDIFKNNDKINSLKHYFDKKQKDKISEFYFVDLHKTPNCYSDVRSRLYTKTYDDFEFSNLLLKYLNIAGRSNDKLEKEHIRMVCHNFTNRIFQRKYQCFTQHLISENQLNLSCVAGSLEFHGDDVPTFIDLIIENLEKYIEYIERKDIYNTEFDKLIECEAKN